MHYRNDGAPPGRQEREELIGLRRTIQVLSVLSVLLMTATVMMGILTFRSFLNQNSEKKEIASITEQYESSQSEVVVLQQQIEALQIQLQTSENTVSQLTQERDTLQEENKVLEEQNHLLQETAISTETAPAAGTAEGAEQTKTIDLYEPGELIPEADVSENPGDYFLSHEILEGDAVYERINGRSYRENPDIGLSELRYLRIAHYNFSHEVQCGEMIVNAQIAENVLNIFRELYEIGYEVESMYLVDNYWTGDGNTTDTASIDVNNTSAFNYRPVTNGGSLSNHAYGKAIDINPQQNPYVWYEGGYLRWSHSNADPYIDRTTGDPHVIVYGDACYNIFIKYGFSWGGNWSNPIDYQHFEYL